MPAELARNSDDPGMSIEACLTDTRHQLEHVIEVSENSANQTMDLVENLLAILKELIESSDQLQTHYLKLSVDEAVGGAAEQNIPIINFMTHLNQHSATMRKGLNTVMETQGFQDITGQVINRVIGLLNEMEKSLDETTFKTPILVNKLQGEGPSIIPDKDTHCTEQNDVDDLLADLGL
ncbi:MAG: hypothetical protein DRQ52_03800 [Gammaproteobacteria bacterium]|nr:MAG: hypothetical protein DRQ52_03800 [Gammaproteobacteria bacterium]